MKTPEASRPAFRWQDIFTVPNAMSLAGAILSWRGSEQLDRPSGLAQVVAGRGIDALDGQVARALGQESNFGATVDAGLDKLSTSKIIYELWKNGTAPKSVLGVIATLSAANLASTAYVMAKRPGEPIRPTKTGKLAMAGETASLFAYAAAHTAENSGREATSAYLRRIGAVAFLLTLPAAIHATASYIKRAQKS